MKRTIIKIDTDKCTGCGLCVSGCHEGALQLIDGKAVMVSELYCDGLGACIGDCPEGAITLEEREAMPYDEKATMKRIIPNGEKVILAHLRHLKNHNQDELVKEGVECLKEMGVDIPLDEFLRKENPVVAAHSGCPGSMARTFNKPATTTVEHTPVANELQQWPVQLHLLSPQAPFLKDADLLLAADCTAYSIGDFHQKFLKGKRLAIACPKLDSGKEIYVEKLAAMIDQSNIQSLTVLMMEVPCCGGLLRIAEMARNQASRKIPIHAVVIGLQGDVVKRYEV